MIVSCGRYDLSKMKLSIHPCFCAGKKEKNILHKTWVPRSKNAQGVFLWFLHGDEKNKKIFSTHVQLCWYMHTYIRVYLEK
jgi:hypothetical protein